MPGYPCLMQRLADLLPEFARQVEDHLRQASGAELADQIPLVAVLRWTYDASADAGFIYVEPSRPLNIAERGLIKSFHSHSVELKGLPGWILVDVDNLGRITGIELLNRADIFSQLSRKQPQKA